jgi:hypothetical protein
MPHQDGLGNNGAEATRLSKPDDGDDRMQKRVKMSRMHRILSNSRILRIHGLAEFAYHTLKRMHFVSA